MADGFADAGDFFSLRSRLHRPSAEAVIAQAILIYRSLRHRQGAGDRKGGDIGFPVPNATNHFGAGLFRPALSMALGPYAQDRPNNAAYL